MERTQERVELQEEEREKVQRPVEAEAVAVEAEYEEVEGDGRQPAEAKPSALFDRTEADDLHTRWNAIQMKFVDEPRAAVAEADALVSDVIHHITEVFDQQRSRLETRWSQGDTLSTEDLRIIVQRYRWFFEHLLSI